MKLRVSALLTSVLLLSTPALAQTEDVVVPAPGPVVAPLPPGGPGPMAFHLRALASPTNGIPPHLVEKLGISRDLAQRVQDASFESNEALIPLEAELKKAQLRLERLLQAPSPDEGAILKQVEEVGRAETAVRRNRIGLMVRVKKLLGPDLWQKLEAEMGPVRFEQRIEAYRGMVGEPLRRPLPPPPPARP